MFAQHLSPALSLLYPPFSLRFKGVCLKKVIKGINCTIVESCLGEAPWCPGPPQFVGFNRASEYTKCFPRSNSVQI